MIQRAYVEPALHQPADADAPHWEAWTWADGLATRSIPGRAPLGPLVRELESRGWGTLILWPGRVPAQLGVEYLATCRPPRVRR